MSNKYQPKNATVAILIDEVHILTKSFTIHKWGHFINIKIPVKLEGMVIPNV